MENKTIIIAVVAFLALILGLPAIMSAANGGGGAARPASGGSPSYEASPAPAVPDEPPTLNAANLAGSQWQVPTEEGDIVVTLNAGGQAQATAPPKYAGLLKMTTGSDVIQGQWTVNGSDLTVTASAMGQTQTVSCTIAGDQVYYEGKPVTRIR